MRPMSTRALPWSPSAAATSVAAGAGVREPGARTCPFEARAFNGEHASITRAPLAYASRPWDGGARGRSFAVRVEGITVVNIENEADGTR
jgi:hypothetical protein